MENIEEVSDPERLGKYLIQRTIVVGGKERNLNEVILQKLSEEDLLPVVLFGLGGTGKTQAALLFAKENRYLYGSDFYHLDVESFSSLFQSYQRCAEILGTNVKSIEIGKVETIIVNSLSKRPNWLLIIDNLNTESMKQKIKSFIKMIQKKDDNNIKDGNTDKHHIIITSIFNNWDDVGYDTIPIHEFSFNEAESFIINALKDKFDNFDDEVKKSVKELINTVGRLPLALAQATGSIRKKPGIPQYIKLFKESWMKRKKLLDEHTVFQQSNHKRSVFTTWITTINYLYQQSEMAIDLIHSLAFLEANNISIELLLYPLLVKGNMELDAVVTSASLISELSLINIDALGEINIHRLLQEVIQIDLKDNKKYDDVLETISIQLERIFDYNYINVDSYKRTNINYLHIKKVIEHAKQLDKFKPIAYRLLQKVSLYELEILGYYNYVRQAFDEIYQFHSKVSNNWENQVAVLMYLAHSWRVMTKFDKAREIYEKAISLTKDPIVLAEINVYIAQTLQGEGLYEEAIEKFANNIYIILDNLPENDIRVAHALSFYSQALRKFKQRLFDESKELLENAIDIYRKNLGENHPKIADKYCDLANLYDDLGNFQKALKYYNKAINRQKEFYGKNHPWTAITYYDMALTHFALDNLSEASNDLNEAISIISSENYVGDLVCFVYLIKFYIEDKSNNKQIALKCLRKVKKGLEQNITNSSSLYNELSWNKRWNDLCESEDKNIDYYSTLLNYLKEVYGDYHPEIANCYRRCGLVYKNLGKLEDAEKCYQKALSILDKIELDRQNTNYKLLISEMETFNKDTNVNTECSNHDKHTSYIEKRIEGLENTHQDTLKSRDIILTGGSHMEDKAKFALIKKASNLPNAKAEQAYKELANEKITWTEIKELCLYGKDSLQINDGEKIVSNLIKKRDFLDQELYKQAAEMLFPNDSFQYKPNSRSNKKGTISYWEYIIFKKGDIDERDKTSENSNPHLVITIKAPGSRDLTSDIDTTLSVSVNAALEEQVEEEKNKKFDLNDSAIQWPDKAKYNPEKQQPEILIQAAVIHYFNRLNETKIGLSSAESRDSNVYADGVLNADYGYPAFVKLDAKQLNLPAEQLSSALKEEKNKEDLIIFNKHKYERHILELAASLVSLAEYFPKETRRVELGKLKQSIKQVWYDEYEYSDKITAEDSQLFINFLEGIDKTKEDSIFKKLNGLLQYKERELNSLGKVEGVNDIDVEIRKLNKLYVEKLLDLASQCEDTSIRQRAVDLALKKARKDPKQNLSEFIKAVGEHAKAVSLQHESQIRASLFAVEAYVNYSAPYHVVKFIQSDESANVSKKQIFAGSILQQIGFRLLHGRLPNKDEAIGEMLYKVSKYGQRVAEMIFAAENDADNNSKLFEINKPLTEAELIKIRRNEIFILKRITRGDEHAQNKPYVNSEFTVLNEDLEYVNNIKKKKSIAVHEKAEAAEKKLKEIIYAMNSPIVKVPSLNAHESVDPEEMKNKLANDTENWLSIAKKTVAVTFFHKITQTKEKDKYKEADTVYVWGAELKKSLIK